MRIARADVLTYRGRVAGARSAATTWSVREGLLLRITSTDGIVGQGEASPLPGYSPDTLDDAATALGSLDWTKIPEHERGVSPREWLGRVESETRLPASAKFALETALLDVISQRLQEPAWRLLCAAGSVAPLPLCSFVGGADEELVVETARAAAERGVHTVKVKLIGASLGFQMDVLTHVRDAIGAVELRLDANRTFSPLTAGRELEPLRALHPELIEEPVPTDALATWKGSPLPVALDESLQGPRAWERLEPHLADLRCVAVVLKPMALGGIFACLDLATRATARGLDVTVSHTFDGPVALAAAAHLALAVASRTRASGLDRHGGLAAWPPVEVSHVGPTSVLPLDKPGLGIPLLSGP